MSGARRAPPNGGGMDPRRSQLRSEIPNPAGAGAGGVDQSGRETGSLKQPLRPTERGQEGSETKAGRGQEEPEGNAGRNAKAEVPHSKNGPG